MTLLKVGDAVFFLEPFLIRTYFTVDKFRFQKINIFSLTLVLFKMFKSNTTLVNSSKCHIYTVLAEMPVL